MGKLSPCLAIIMLMVASGALADKNPITGDWDGDGTTDLGWIDKGAGRIWLCEGWSGTFYACSKFGPGCCAEFRFDDKGATGEALCGNVDSDRAYEVATFDAQSGAVYHYDIDLKELKLKPLQVSEGRYDFYPPLLFGKRVILGRWNGDEHAALAVVTPDDNSDSFKVQQLDKHAEGWRSVTAFYFGKSDQPTQLLAGPFRHCESEKDWIGFYYPESGKLHASCKPKEVLELSPKKIVLMGVGWGGSGIALFDPETRIIEFVDGADGRPTSMPEFPPTGPIFPSPPDDPEEKTTARR